MRVLTQNLRHGGLQTPDGAAEDRWPCLAEVITGTRPDVVCLQELQGWRDHNHQQLYRAEHDLGLQVAGWIPPARSLGGTLVMYRPGRLRQTQWEDKSSTELTNGMGVPVFAAEGAAWPIAVISVHLSSTAAPIAAAEAAHAAHRAVRYSPAGIIAGDFNSLAPTDVIAADEEEALCLASRWSGPAHAPAPDPAVVQCLARAGYTDAAQHLAEETGETSLLGPTVADPARLDRIYLSPPLVPALTSYEVIHHDHSDHAAVLADLDLTRLHTPRA